MDTAAILVAGLVAVGIVVTAVAAWLEAPAADPLDDHYATVIAALGEEVAR